MRLNTKNNAKTTLALAIDATQTSITVTDGTQLPDAPCRITVDDEIMHVTYKNVNTLDVLRGQEGTTAIPHNAGASVENRLTAGTMDEIFNSTQIEFGYGAYGLNGLAIGPSAYGYNGGIAVGSGAYGPFYGVAIGQSSSGSDDGVAIGYGALGYDFGVGIGSGANGAYGGTAVGFLASANANNYAFAKGYRSVASRFNEEVKSCDGSSPTKYSYSTLAWQGQTTDANWTELFLGEMYGQRAFVLPASAFTFSIIITALKNDCTEAKSWKIEGLIKRDNANNTVLVSTPSKTTIAASAGASSWDVAVTINDVDEALVLNVVGAASTTINWIARGEITEVRI